jgi:hypothetical protein
MASPGVAEISHQMKPRSLRKFARDARRLSAVSREPDSAQIQPVYLV